MRPKNEETKKKIYDFINKYIQENRVSPTVREIAKGVNCAVSREQLGDEVRTHSRNGGLRQTSNGDTGHSRVSAA